MLPSARRRPEWDRRLENTDWVEIETDRQTAQQTARHARWTDIVDGHWTDMSQLTQFTT